MGTLAGTRIPPSTVERLPLYLRALLDDAVDGAVLVSSVRLAALTGLSAATVRKDLAALGSPGLRGVGYDVRTVAYDRVGNQQQATPVVHRTP